MTSIDEDVLAEVVAAIPTGCWASYGDVAHACGGNDRHARTLNQRFIRLSLPNAHRVLLQSGKVSPTALGDARAAAQRLEAEGVPFHDGRASPDTRYRGRELARAGPMP